MMLTDTHETIRAYLDRGGAAADHPVTYYAEDVLQYRLTDRDTATEQARGALDTYVAVLRDHPEDAHLLRAAREMRWEIELLTDDDVAERFIAGLDSEFVAGITRAAGEALARRAAPVTINIGDEGTYRCQVSGEDRQGRPLLLTHEMEGVTFTVDPEAVREALRGLR